MTPRITPLLILTILAGCREVAPPAPTPADPAVEAVLRKINERLALMEEVAAYKWAHGKEIDDPQREESMLRDLEAQAADHGLSPLSVRWFFSAQVEAAKQTQQNLHRHWGEAAIAPDAPADLSDVRRKIDTVNNELLAAFAEARKKPPSRALIENVARAVIVGPGIDQKVRTTAIRPLLEVD